MANKQSRPTLFDILNKENKDHIAKVKKQNYYIREASRPTGTRKKSDDEQELQTSILDEPVPSEANDVEIEPIHPNDHINIEVPIQYKDIQETESNKQEKGKECDPKKENDWTQIAFEDSKYDQEKLSLPPQKIEILLDTLDTSDFREEVEEEIKPQIEEIHVLKAIPAKIQEEISDVNPSLDPPPIPTRPNHLNISSDPDYSIEMTYNVENDRILKKYGLEEMTEASKSPEGLKYISKNFDTDENYNQINDNKKSFLRSMTLEEDDNDIEIESRSKFLRAKEPFTEIPSHNHYNIINEIANEKSGDYNVEQISSPAEYKSLNERISTNEDIQQKKQKDHNPEKDMTDFSLSCSDIQLEEKDSPILEVPLTPEKEIYNVQEMHIVKKLLNTISNTKNNDDVDKPKVQNKFSFKDIKQVQEDAVDSPIEDVNQVEEEDVPSVRRISKIFDNVKNNKSNQVYSLTARNTPREFRQEFKEEKSVKEETIKEAITSDSPLEDAMEFPKAKSRIAFFEQLKK